MDNFARASFPASITVLLMLLIETPLVFSGQATLLPATAIGGVWFWSLTQPDYLPPPVVFLIGLLLDLLGYLPPGVGVLTLLCVHGVALAFRRFLAQRGFAWVWLVFAAVAAGAVAAGVAVGHAADAASVLARPGDPSGQHQHRDLSASGRVPGRGAALHHEFGAGVA